MSLDRVPVVARQHEYHLVPDRSRWLDFEVQQIQEVYAHYAGQPDKVPVPPLYGAEAEAGGRPVLGYTIRRRARRCTIERTTGRVSDYAGSDVFLSLVEPARLDESRDEGVAELSVRALCTNRHLPEQLPSAPTGVRPTRFGRGGGGRFPLRRRHAARGHLYRRPTAPREAVVSAMRSRTETAHTGAVAWRLINILSLNHLGLVSRGAGGNAEALREVLMLFANLKDSAVERGIRGVRSVDSRPVIRRLAQRTGTGTAARH